MAAEGARDRGVFRIGTRPREVAPVITPPPARPEVRPQTSPSPSRQPDKRPTLTPEKKPKNKLLGRLVLAGGLAVFAVGITGTVIKLTEGSSQETETSTSFDPAKDEGTMGQSNTIFVSREELDNYPKWTENGDPIIVISVPKNQGVRYGIVSRERLAINAGAKNVLYQYGVPAGEIIYAPLDGYLSFETPGPENPLLRGLLMSFTRLDGKKGTFSVGGANEGRPFDPVFEALVPAPIVYTTGGDRNKMLAVKRGDPILKTTEEVDLAYQIGATGTSDNIIVQSLNLLTSSSNSTTELKLVAPQS